MADMMSALMGLFNNAQPGMFGPEMGAMMQQNPEDFSRIMSNLGVSPPTDQEMLAKGTLVPPNAGFAQASPEAIGLGNLMEPTQVGGQLLGFNPKSSVLSPAGQVLQPPGAQPFNQPLPGVNPVQNPMPNPVVSNQAVPNKNPEWIGNTVLDPTPNPAVFGEPKEEVKPPEQPRPSGTVGRDKFPPVGPGTAVTKDIQLEPTANPEVFDKPEQQPGLQPEQPKVEAKPEEQPAPLPQAEIVPSLDENISGAGTSWEDLQKAPETGAGKPPPGPDLMARLQSAFRGIKAPENPRVPLPSTPAAPRPSGTISPMDASSIVRMLLGGAGGGQQGRGGLSPLSQLLGGR